MTGGGSGGSSGMSTCGKALRADGVGAQSGDKFLRIVTTTPKKENLPPCLVVVVGVS